MKLTSAQTDRACGALLGMACGDALGAGYEFGVAPLGRGERAAMIGGGLGNFAPGEWTDDTSMGWVVAEVAASGLDLRTPEALDAIAAGFARWYADGPPDVGILTSRVLGSVGLGPTGAEMAAAAAGVFYGGGRAGGNGSLMRTAAVALAHLDEPEAVVSAALAVSSLTHGDPVAGQACALWSLAIRHAILHGTLDGVSEAVDLLPAGSREFWSERLAEAEREHPSRFRPNGYVVTALQAAWSSIVHIPVPEDDPAAGHFACAHALDALDAAVHIGDDTDTVAAIAGMLLGARWGASAFPAAWRELVHGWPGRSAADLTDLASLAVRGGRPDKHGWPTCPTIDYSGWGGHEGIAVHPHDPGLYLAAATALEAVPDDVTAVVTLCRVGREQVPGRLRRIGFRLMDTNEADNPNLDYVIDDAARTIARLREEGEVVLLHCVAGQSRTPTVAARYSTLLDVPTEAALRDVVRRLPTARPNPVLVAALRRLATMRGDLA
jgi:ADP-ribosyl-[dinitrogen reductase] hydrolase